MWTGQDKNEIIMYKKIYLGIHDQKNKLLGKKTDKLTI